ncbi:MAG TPA: glycine cleavage system aminomethyltransferase GcvT [Ignavibacteriaceae bacterium]|jgi:aminomethyltransferase|nr:MAG: Aminomethyltransferase [Ignavibacteria bacterium ADurb.Bin266]OQY75966.1 MAG: glycine cleavage system protein T [Ignavibacteriales bacterium UTCHB2]HQF41603.1 glycine cleavage system aminomethyltransferase GcvT [Ignavibacteriaceae bacterium]HQI41088.1 glycine cleavage system aminomethyltransferase GcvT [Ignavibacteriaceae bacterium]HQJ45109.1 glycine cleavage system aminomethyltransferase GcvT [Ignavibacteriaceae bacterium]
MKRTNFYNIHKKLGAKLVEFAGFEMPIQYSSIIAEHKTVRNSVGVFDVSHMGEVFVKGEKALDFVQHIAVNDTSKLQTGRVQYTAMCYEDGGIVDDLLVYKIADDEFLLVINASNIEKDFEWMQKHNQFGVELRNESDDYSLLAVQGPNSLKTLQKLTDAQIDMEYYHFTKLNMAGVDMILSRTGYTGEVGYELYFKGDEKVAENLWNKIFEAGKEFDIQPVGLAARDTLRLEMGFCLYGNDIDQTTNPLEAGLGWITKLSKQNFIGKDALVKIKESGLKRKLVAIMSDEKTFPRHGYDISVNNNKIGTVTSGTVSPMLDKPIALGYVETKFSEIGADVNFLIRGKEIPAKVVKLPFVKR